MARGGMGIRSHEFAHCFLLFGWPSCIYVFAILMECPHRFGVLWVLATGLTVDGWCYMTKDGWYT
jgi:hypothetical protein